ncbi:hypothetical protein, partial [Clavibacter michiganensis]|uniref:hypothetical protein n=1 Tax=Clavibacter michiganensis TaxID=28447 RepID=UPI00292FC443
MTYLQIMTRRPLEEGDHFHAFRASLDLGLLAARGIRRVDRGRIGHAQGATGRSAGEGGPHPAARAGGLVKRTHSEPHWEKKQGATVAWERVTLYGVP